MRRRGGRSRWRGSGTSGYRRTSIRARRRLRSGCCFTRGGFTRSTRLEGRTGSERRWILWIWRERRGLRYSLLLLTVLGKTIRYGFKGGSSSGDLPVQACCDYHEVENKQTNEGHDDLRCLPKQKARTYSLGQELERIHYELRI